MMAIWQEIKRLNRRLDDSWLGDALGAVCLMIFSIMTLFIMWGIA